MVGLWLVYTVGQCDIFGEIARGDAGVFVDFLEKLKNGLLLVVKDGGFLLRPHCVRLPTRPPLLRRAGRVGLCFFRKYEKVFDFME